MSRGMAGASKVLGMSAGAVFDLREHSCLTDKVMNQEILVRIRFRGI
jgi:hypothetical protein